jgi:pimeloyl-ACP methyl ester carboxylesterase
MNDSSAWLLLHGTPLTPQVWDGIRPYLEAERPVAAPLLPRPADSRAPQAEIAQAVLASLPATGPLHVVGHSFGGQVALEVAIAAPLAVASLTILCSRATPFPAFAATAASLRHGDPLDIEGSLARWFLAEELSTNGSVVRYARTCLTGADRGAWADDLDAIATYDRTDELNTINIPTTVIAAEHDKVGTPTDMRSLATAVPNSSFELVPDASHMSQFLHPEALAERLSQAAHTPT